MEIESKTRLSLWFLWGLRPMQETESPHYDSWRWRKTKKGESQEGWGSPRQEKWYWGMEQRLDSGWELEDVPRSQWSRRIWRSETRWAKKRGISLLGSAEAQKERQAISTIGDLPVGLRETSSVELHSGLCWEPIPTVHLDLMAARQLGASHQSALGNGVGLGKRDQYQPAAYSVFKCLCKSLWVDLNALHPLFPFILKTTLRAELALPSFCTLGN